MLNVANLPEVNCITSCCKLQIVWFGFVVCNLPKSLIASLPIYLVYYSLGVGFKYIHLVLKECPILYTTFAISSNIENAEKVIKNLIQVNITIST